MHNTERDIGCKAQETNWYRRPHWHCGDNVSKWQSFQTASSPGIWPRDLTTSHLRQVPVPHVACCVVRDYIKPPRCMHLSVPTVPVPLFPCPSSCPSPQVSMRTALSTSPLRWGGHCSASSLRRCCEGYHRRCSTSTTPEMAGNDCSRVARESHVLL